MRADLRRYASEVLETEKLRRAALRRLASEAISAEELLRADLRRHLEFVSKAISQVFPSIRSVEKQISYVLSGLGRRWNEVRQVKEHIPIQDEDADFVLRVSRRIPIPEDEPKIIVRVSCRIPIQDEDADFSR